MSELRKDEYEDKERCGNCRYYCQEPIDCGYVCVNDKSWYCADWVEENDWCTAWEGKMNKDINHTLMALVPILKANRESVKSIEAVRNWYKIGEREYCKEVAEITYENDHRIYADIGSDSNLTAVYDVMAVIQGLKPRSEAISRIERGVYEMPDDTEKHYTKLCKGKPCPYIEDCDKNGLILFCRKDDERKRNYYIKRLIPNSGFYSFKNACKRDDMLKEGYSRENLQIIYGIGRLLFPDVIPPSIDVWIEELKEMGMYKEENERSDE